MAVEQEASFELAFEDELNKKKSIIHKPTILICGYTGVGKTSLIQKICGRDIVSDEKISNGVPCTQDFDVYENDFIRIYDSKGLEPGDTEEEFSERVEKFILERRRDEDKDKHIHIIWYCVQGPGARVTDCDRYLINSIFNRNNEIGVITKKDITRQNQFQGIKKELIKSGLSRTQIIAVSDEDRKSLLALIEKTREMLPSARRDAFEAAQILDLESKRKKAVAVIHSASASAAAAGAIPIPTSDAPILMGVQVSMIAGLAVIYGMAEETIKHTMLPALAKAVGMATASSLVKLFPGIGSVIQATVAASITEAMGFYTLSYLEKVARSRITGEPVPEATWDPKEFKRILEDLK